MSARNDRFLWCALLVGLLAVCVCVFAACKIAYHRGWHDHVHAMRIGEIP